MKKNWAKNIKRKTIKGIKVITGYTCPVCNEHYSPENLQIPSFVDRLMCDCGELTWFKVKD